MVLVDSQTRALAGFAGYRHEFFQARSINVNTAQIATLFNNMGGFYNVVLGAVQRIKTPDGYRVTASNYRLQTDDGTVSVPDGKLYLYSFSLDKAAAHMICDASEDATGFLVAPDGTPVAYVEHIPCITNGASTSMPRRTTRTSISNSPTVFRIRPICPAFKA